MKLRILVVDDEPDFLNRCGAALRTAGYHCDLCGSADDAYEKCQRQPYDCIICDILIPFRGVREGGLVLGRDYFAMCPSAWVVFVSQFVTARWINALAGFPNHAFVEKGDSALEDLVRKIDKIAKPKFAFACMPFAPVFEDVYQLGVKPVAQELGFKCVRADELEHNKGILEVIYDQIESAQVVVADMTGRNPNVYYEVGYAHALGKDVVLLAQKADDLPFDLRGFNHIVYDGRITVLKEKLSQRLKAMLTDASRKK